MTEKKFRKFASSLDGGKFRELVEAAVDFDCKNLDGTKIVGTARYNLIEIMSLDYQTGSNFTKNKYLTVGYVSGVVTVVSFLTIKKVLKQKKRGVLTRALSFCAKFTPPIMERLIFNLY